MAEQAIASVVRVSSKYGLPSRGYAHQPASYDTDRFEEDVEEMNGGYRVNGDQMVLVITRSVYAMAALSYPTQRAGSG